MAIYRTIQMSFWTDTKVADDLTPEDRYFYLYLLTNPHTNLCGCYELSLKQASDETGYTKDTIERLFERFQNYHGIAHYCKQTKEVLLVKWAKYNWTSSDKFRKPLAREINHIKCSGYKQYLMMIFEAEDTVSIPYIYPMDTTDTVSVTDTVTDSDNNTESEIEDLFNALWLAYPRKKGKSAVSKKAKKELYRLGYDKVMKCIDRYKAEVKGVQEQFILHGSTFFNGRYTDYLDENYSPPVRKGNNRYTAYEQRTDVDYDKIEEMLTNKGVKVN